MTIRIQTNQRPLDLLGGAWKKMLLFLSVFGPATITAMADNDASGVAFRLHQQRRRSEV